MMAQEAKRSDQLEATHRRKFEMPDLISQYIEYYY